MAGKVAILMVNVTRGMIRTPFSEDCLNTSSAGNVRTKQSNE